MSPKKGAKKSATKSAAKKSAPRETREVREGPNKEGATRQAENAQRRGEPRPPASAPIGTETPSQAAAREARNTPSPDKGTER